MVHRKFTRAHASGNTDTMNETSVRIFYRVKNSTQEITGCELHMEGIVRYITSFHMHKVSLAYTSKNKKIHF